MPGGHGAAGTPAAATFVADPAADVDTAASLACVDADANANAAICTTNRRLAAAITVADKDAG